MSTSLSKTIIIGLFFLFILISGFGLSRSGKPYGTLIFNIHKMIGLAAGIFLIVTVVRIGQTAALRSVEIGAIVVTALIFVGLVAAGGLLSVFDTGGMANASQALRAATKAVHHVLPYLAILSTVATLYLLLSHRM
ncbi:MAG: hypothetical protein HY781_08105 [Chloroflexi bacterium]|nr:hypothetical protein [Chloroflexota bacterium]